MKKLLGILFNHERYQTISFLVVLVLLLWFFGCEPRCKSIIYPDQTVTRPELELEIESVIAKANIGYATLEKQEQLRDILLQQAMNSVSTGSFNPVALISSVAAVLGVGTAVDNVRKRKEIKRLTT